MTMQTKIKRLIRDERGAVAVLMTVFIVVLVGLMATAVDLGVVYSARGELQNAADSASLAAAATMISVGPGSEAVAQPDAAVESALQYAGANEALGVSLSLVADDLTMGYWDSDLGDFDPDRTGPSDNPDDLTAVRVKLRRDNVANSPISTYFAKIIGLNEVNASATSTAFVGHAGAVPGGGGGGGGGGITLPIALHASSITDSDGEPEFGISLSFAGQSDNASWTSFFKWPTSDCTIRKFLNGTYTSPAIEVGDRINLTNGKLSNPTFNLLEGRFESEGTDTDGDGDADEWLVLLPVVEDTCHCSTGGKVVGFAYILITEVRPAPHKDVIGYLIGGMMIPDSPTGGANFGVRASQAVIVETG